MKELLFALATAQPRRGVGRERISYRELAIEQLGSVYEGLLEYEPKVAAEPMLALRVQGHEFVLSPAELQRLCRQKELELAGPEGLLNDPTLAPLKPEPVSANDDNAEDEEPEEEEGEETADEPEEETTSAIKNRAKARLFRRLETGEFFFAPGSARKSSGSYYTVDEIVQYLSRHALGGLVEGRSPGEILKLRVIDLACGSAHFLVGAARYLGKALWEAYHREHGTEPPPEFLLDHQPEKRKKLWEAEGEAWSKRRVVEQCLYGVDLNPTAVQLAQVALWIESLAGDRPLSFFAHHIRNGNSLLGSTLARLDEPTLPDLSSGREADIRGLFEHNLREEIAAALQQRRLIDSPLPPELRADTPEEYTYKQHRLDEAERLIKHARLLFDLRSAAAFVPAIWPVWTSLVAAADLEIEARHHAWWPEFENVRERERFFHWELEFPEQFFGGRNGFDAIIGNPPWDKVLPAKVEFYASHDVLIRAFKGAELDRRIRELHDANPALAGEFDTYQERTKTTARILRNGGDFPLSEGRTAAAHEDLSKFFLERATQFVRTGGRVGLLLPSVVYNGDGCAGLRRWLIEDAAILKFYGFENRRRIFDIDSRYKFVCLCFAKEKNASREFAAAFMRHDPAELELPGPHPWEVRISADEVRWLSPESFAFLEFRGPRDREILLKMYRNATRLGGDEVGSWGVRFVSWRSHEFIYNASEDKDLWTDPKTGRLFDPTRVLGGSSPDDPNELIQQMYRHGFVPIYEGKHVEQFLYGLQPIRWWLSLELAHRKYGRQPIDRPLLVFRETASNTNQRTCLAAVLPAHSATSHKLSGIIPKAVSQEVAATVLNSFCFDYALRMRTAGTNISFTYMRPMPVPSAQRIERLSAIPMLNGWETPSEYATDRRELWEPLWRSNRAVAEAYGLDADDFSHVLSSFPSFARKRSEFFMFIQQQCAAWAAEGK